MEIMGEVTAPRTTAVTNWMAMHGQETPKPLPEQVDESTSLETGLTSQSAVSQGRELQ